MTRHRTAPWPASEDLKTGHRWPLLLVLIAAPITKLMPIQEQLESDAKSHVAQILMIVYAIMLLFWWVAALVFSTVFWGFFVAFVAFNAWALWHVCTWLFEKKDGS